MMREYCRSNGAVAGCIRLCGSIGMYWTSDRPGASITRVNGEQAVQSVSGVHVKPPNVLALSRAAFIKRDHDRARIGYQNAPIVSPRAASAAAPYWTAVWDRCYRVLVVSCLCYAYKSDCAAMPTGDQHRAIRCKLKFSEPLLIGGDCRL